MKVILLVTLLVLATGGLDSFKVPKPSQLLPHFKLPCQLKTSWSGLLNWMKSFRCGSSTSNMERTKRTTTELLQKLRHAIEKPVPLSKPKLLPIPKVPIRRPIVNKVLRLPKTPIRQSHPKWAFLKGLL